MRKIIKNLPVVLLVSSIALSPSFSAGYFRVATVAQKNLEIRIEDILIVILGLIWISGLLISGRRELKKPPLFFPILLWLSFSFISLLTNWLFQNLSFAGGFFYFLKYLEFFVFYFYIFYHIRNIDSAKFIIKLWIFLGLLNVGYLFFQLLAPEGFSIYRATGGLLRGGEYGWAAIGEAGVFPTGAFFLIIFIFLVNLFLYYFLGLNISKFKKGILGMAMVSPALGVIGSCSQTNFLGFIFALFLTFFFFFLRKKSFKLILISILVFIFLSVLFFLVLKYIPSGYRLLFMFPPSRIPGNYWSSRGVFFLSLLKESLENPFLPFLGLGIGSVTEAHNQYIRNFIEIGIIGSLAFFFLILVILKIAFKCYSKKQDSFSLGLSAGLLTATLTMLFLSLATDPFIVVKPASVYWSFTAITMAVIYVNQRKHLRHCNKS